MPKVFEEVQQLVVWARTERGEDLVAPVAAVRTGEAAVATAMAVQAAAVVVVQEDTVEKLFAGLIGL